MSPFVVMGAGSGASPALALCEAAESPNPSRAFGRTIPPFPALGQAARPGWGSALPRAGSGIRHAVIYTLSQQWDRRRKAASGIAAVTCASC